jgi:hypothetical protein
VLGFTLVLTFVLALVDELYSGFVAAFVFVVGVFMLALLFSLAFVVTPEFDVLTGSLVAVLAFTFPASSLTEVLVLGFSLVTVPFLDVSTDALLELVDALTLGNLSGLVFDVVVSFVDDVLDVDGNLVPLPLFPLPVVAVPSVPEEPLCP